MPTPFNSSGQTFDGVFPMSGSIVPTPASATATARPPTSVSAGGFITIAAPFAKATAVAQGPSSVDDGFSLTLDQPPSDWPVNGEMHFRLEDPVLGRLELSCENGYVVREYDFAPPTIREVTFNNSFDDGTYDFTRFIGSRAVTLDIVLRPTQNVDGTGAQYVEPEMRDALLAFTHPSRRPRLQFSEHGDTRVKEIELRGSSFSAAVSKPRFNVVNVSWVAPRGVIESSSLKCLTQYIGEVAGVRQFGLNNQGNMNAHWTVTIKGEIQKPVIYLDGDETVALELEYDANVGDVVTISSFDRSVKVNGARAGYRYLSDNSTWFTIPPGNHTMYFASSDTTRVGYPFGKWENDAVAPLTTWAGNGPHPDPDDPGVPPPWGWSSQVDPETGEPGITEITVCYRSTWI